MQHKELKVDFTYFIEPNRLYDRLSYILMNWEGSLKEAINHILNNNVINNILNDSSFSYEIIKKYLNDTIKNGYADNTYNMHHAIIKYVLTEHVFKNISETFVYNMLVDYINENGLEYSEHYVEMISVNIDYDNKWQNESKQLVKNLLTF